MRVESFQLFLIALTIGGALVLAGAVIECLAAPQRNKLRHSFFNLRYFAAASLIQFLLAPFMSSITGFVVGAAAGGPISIPAHGWRFIAGASIYVIAMDFGEYLFHRAQHRLPWLWAMHSLHHSDAKMNVSTTLRHFWGDHLIKSVTIFLVVGCIFKIDLEVAAIYNIVSLYNYVTHANIDLGFGRWSVALNSPRYHRIHHSALAEHHDLNFAALFPIFDVLFGSYHRPLRGEFPETGLGLNDPCPSLFDAVIWPLRAFRPPAWL
jgi:sterol desaturase/sphingolipid hydroxylase (fatty acid hydroxylase superfamily)